MPKWNDRMRALSAELARGLKSGDWLDRERVLVYSRRLLFFETVVFLFLVALTHYWIIPLSRPTTTDFVSFYSAGALANAGTPQLAYDPAQHYAAEQQVTEPGIKYNFFYYPPVFLMLSAVFARMPYLVGFVVFETLALIPFLFVGRAILREPGYAAFMPLLAFPSVYWTIGLGQNGLITAALFGAGTLLVDRRPALAGMLFGALIYKPHFGLLIPVALAAGGRWRAFLGASAAVAALCLASLWLYGWETWRDYLALAATSPATYEAGRIDLGAMVSVFGAVRISGGGIALAYAVQGVAALASAAAVIMVWRRGLSLPVRAATLAAGTILAVPVELMYDYLLALVALIWLVRLGRESGFLPWEKTALAIIFLVPLVCRDIANHAHVQIAPFASLALLGFALWHGRREMAARSALSA
jgi:alpha-1,2-mannosyltransferase